MKIWAGVLLVALGSGGAVAQAGPGALPAKLAAVDYSGEAVVVKRFETVYRYNADGTGTKLDTNTVKVQSEAAVQALGVLSLPFASGTQKLEIVYLRVRKVDGTVVDTPPSDAQDQAAPVTQQAPFYSDLHVLQVPIRGLAVGDDLEYQVRTVFTKAEAPKEFWGVEGFGQGAVMLERLIELHVPKAMYVQVSSPKYKAEVSETDGERVYRWHGSQLKPTPKAVKNTDKDDAKDDEKPTEPAEKLPAIAWTTFRSWAEVGEWYRSLSADRMVVTPALKAKADELTVGAATPELKIAALYGYVGPRIRYIGVAFGIGRFQPHEASVVLDNQYGDCKDKHTLLAALLTAEGFPVSAVLVGAGIEFNEAVPSPSAFNHLITLTGVTADKQDIWLDATAEVAPFRLLDASIRDKQVLVIPAVGVPTIQRTPAELPFAAFTRFEGTGTLTKDGVLKAHVDVTMRGDDELTMRQVLRQVTPAQWDQVSQYYSRAYSFGGETSKTTADPPDHTGQPLHLHYEYTRKDYGDWPNYRILPMMPAIILPLVGVKKAPTEAIDLGSRQTQTAVSRITLPESFSADLPPAVHLHTSFLSVEKTYKLDSTKQPEVLTVERTLTIDRAKVPVSEWPAYKKFLADAVDVGEPWIQLTRPLSEDGKSATSKGPPKAGEYDMAAAGLVQEAGVALRNKDWTTAANKLDLVKAKNPLQIGLWADYAALAVHDGKPEESIKDLREELKNHPEEARMYRVLAAQLLRQHPQEAIDTLQMEVERDPTDDDTTLYLASILNGRGDHTKAETVLRAGVAASGKNTNLKMRLGITLVQEGKKDEGGAMLREVLETSNDPSQLNDAAYELGDAAMDLPLADKASRRSLELLDEATRNGETGAVALRRMNLLFSAWDTRGWLLHADGKDDDGEVWVRGAWRNEMSAEVGYHLGVLLEKKGKKDEALTTYTLAAAGSAGTNAAEVTKMIQERIDALRKAGATTGVQDARMELQRLRTYTVPSGKSQTSGYAMFEFGLSSDGPTQVRFVSGDQSFQPFTETLPAMDLKLSIPKESHALVLRHGLLSCGKECQLVLVPPQSAATQQ